jgi:cytochrome b6-f complex iron-sulfur subunit
MKSEAQTRREFCAQACQVASLAAVAAALQACGGGSNPSSPSGVASLPVINATPANGSVALTIDAGSPLVSVGSAALVQLPNDPILVAHTAQDAFVALSGICTHQLCTITGFGSGTYVCPCHGSQYDTSGRVLNGPATRALAQHETDFSNDVLSIAV